MKIKKIGVIGCGLMGSGIAHTSARAGYTTIVRESNQELLEKGMSNLFGFIEKSIARKKATEFELRQVKSNLMGTIDLQDIADCDFIVEAIPESIELKNDLYEKLDEIAKPEAIFGSNTSSLIISEMAKATQRKDRFIGLHFFNPVPIMNLVEVVRTDETADEPYNAALDWCKRIDKTPVACVDTTGFVVNRLLVPYLLDAIRALEAGIATIQDIDNAMMLGCGYPMGPLTLLDYVGLETTHYIAEIMTADFGLPQYHSPELLKKMVEAGLLGKKSKKGFYDYSDPRAPVPADLSAFLK